MQDKVNRWFYDEDDPLEKEFQAAWLAYYGSQSAITPMEKEAKAMFRAGWFAGRNST